MTPLTGPFPASHGFFTRIGGVSTGPYASLNCSFSGADEPRNIIRNRALVAEAMGVSPENLLGVKQVHGTAVVDVEQPWVLHAGPQADAIVLARPGYAISVITADCAPVLFASRQGHIVAAAHAGWRGALAGILEATATAMRAKGASDIQAYEVSADLRDPVLAQNPAAEKFFSDGRPGRWQFDLPAYCQYRLEQAGIAAAILPHDTCADEQNFFSHRRRTLRGEPAIGHQISVIKL
jgi:YfiH family protein